MTDAVHNGDYDDQVQVITLVRGRLANRRPFHAVLGIPPSRYQAFQAAQATGARMDLTAWGSVLHTGWGFDPTPDLWAQLQADHGAVPDLGAAFRRAFEATAEFLIDLQPDDGIAADFGPDASAAADPGRSARLMHSFVALLPDAPHKPKDS